MQPGNSLNKPPNCPIKRDQLKYISGKLLAWAEKLQISICHIQPGKPQQNAYVERYNRTVRHEWLDQHIIESIEEAQNYATKWLWTYNNERPNMALGEITPAQKLKRAARVLPIIPSDLAFDTRPGSCSD